MKSKSLFALAVIFLACCGTPVSAAVHRPAGQIVLDVYQWAGENAVPVSIVAASVLLVLLAFLVLRKKRRGSVQPVGEEAAAGPKPKPTAKTSADSSPVTLVRDTGLTGENERQFGTGIVRAAWILGLSAILCVLLVLANHQYRSPRYAPLDKLTYLDTWTGKCYYADGRKIE